MALVNQGLSGVTIAKWLRLQPESSITMTEKQAQSSGFWRYENL
jgi:hypothetical protein